MRGLVSTWDVNMGTAFRVGCHDKQRTPPPRPCRCPMPHALCCSSCDRSGRFTFESTGSAVWNGQFTGCAQLALGPPKGSPKGSGQNCTAPSAFGNIALDNNNPPVPPPPAPVTWPCLHHPHAAPVQTHGLTQCPHWKRGLVLTLGCCRQIAVCRAPERSGAE